MKKFQRNLKRNSIIFCKENNLKMSPAKHGGRFFVFFFFFFLGGGGGGGIKRTIQTWLWLIHPQALGFETRPPTSPHDSFNGFLVNNFNVQIVIVMWYRSHDFICVVQEARDSITNEIVVGRSKQYISGVIPSLPHLKGILILNTMNRLSRCHGKIESSITYFLDPV